MVSREDEREVTRTRARRTRNDRRRKGVQGDGEASARAGGRGRGEGRIDATRRAIDETRRERAILNAPRAGSPSARHTRVICCPVRAVRHRRRRHPSSVHHCPSWRRLLVRTRARRFGGGRALRPFSRTPLRARLLSSSPARGCRASPRRWPPRRASRRRLAARAARPAAAPPRRAARASSAPPALSSPRSSRDAPRGARSFSRGRRRGRRRAVAPVAVEEDDATSASVEASVEPGPAAMPTTPKGAVARLGEGGGVQAHVRHHLAPRRG